MSGAAGLGWFGIVRLGAVQAAIGAMVMLVTSLLNRVMVVEYALAAAIPGALVGWHYAVQLSRPLWGFRADASPRRTPAAPQRHTLQNIETKSWIDRRRRLAQQFR